MSDHGIIFNIQRFSVNDGPGIRTTVFLKGCQLACRWCHNPEGRAMEIEHKNGHIIGKAYDAEELMTIIEKDRVFYDESGGGVTFSGGEPLAQPEFLSEMLRLCRQAGIHTAVDTTGYADMDIFQDILPNTDLFLYDLKLMDPVLHLKYTEVSNHEILENLEFLIQNKAGIIIRIPMIPGITATQSNLGQIKNYLSRFRSKPEINLLPYHRIADGKYRKFRIPNPMNGSNSLNEEDMKIHAIHFEEAGFKVQIGG
jgi:pyruvate formate lyase activating enzyme